MTYIAYDYMGQHTYSPGETPKGYFPIILEDKENHLTLIETEWRKLEHGRSKDEKYTPTLSAPKGHITRRDDTGEKVGVVAFKKKTVNTSTQVEVKEYTEDYIITALYRVNDDRVEPISAHTGHGMTGMVALPFGILGWFMIRMLISFIKKWRGKSKSRTAAVRMS